MTRLLALLAVVLTAGVVVTELVMHPNDTDRVEFYSIYGVTAVVTVGLFRLGSVVSARSRSLATAIGGAGIGSVVVVGTTVALASQRMILADHDRLLVLVAAGLGMGLGVALALAVAGSVTGDLARLRAAADRVGRGELSARAGVARRDEVGDAATAFDRMATQLETSEEERRVLLASISHDLRTPLASLRAAIEALEDGLAPDPIGYLRGMGRDVEHLGRLVDDLFLLARLEAGRYQLFPEPVDLAELGDEAVEALTPLAVARGVKLVSLAAGAAPVVVDPWAIGRVLRNLLDNAIRYTPAGASVTIEIGSDGFAVVDEGPGFPPGLPAFDLFSRGDPARGGEHAGLGLAVARAIIEAHGGTIGIGGGPGGRVVVRL